MKKLSILLILCVSSLSSCGTFVLGTAVPQTAKTANQQQLDNLECKDKARLAASTTERQVGAFLLGMTIIGAPAAFEIEKSKQREVFKSCMEGKGYKVIPASDASTTNAPDSSAPVTTSAKITTTGDWVQTALTPTMIATGASSFQNNPSTNSGLIIYPINESFVTDPNSFIRSRIGNQAGNLDNSITKDIVQTVINGFPVTQAEVVGNVRFGQKPQFTYLMTFFEADGEIILVNIWSPTSSFGAQKDSFMQILNTLSGVKPSSKAAATPTPIKINVQSAAESQATSSSLKRLNELNELLKKGLINQQDYNVKKNEILKSL